MNKKYPCLSLVETYRTPKGPRQKIILTLGNIDVPKEQWGILADMLERRLVGQQSLVEEPQNLINVAETIIERIRRKGRLKAAEPNPSDVVTTDITQIEVEQPRMLGPLLAAEEFWGRLQMQETLKQSGFSDKQIMLTKADVYNRLICPMSENRVVDWIKRTAVEDIDNSNNKAVNINKDALYRVTDKLIKHKDEIEKGIGDKEKDLFNLEQAIYLYDTTSAYFEGKANGNDKARHGHNKDGHPECKQVVVGLVLDKEGFVSRHEVYEGNRQDITTLTDIVDKLRDKTGDKDTIPTVIVDRGMASEENLKEIKNRGMNYIVAAQREINIF